MIMSSHKDTTHLPPPLDLSGWRKLPAVLDGCRRNFVRDWRNRAVRRILVFAG